MRHRRGYSYLELLIATLLISIAAAGAVSTWVISSRAPANKRVTEMGVYLAVREIERLKTLKYMGLTSGLQGTRYYDRYGAPDDGNNPVPQGYRIQSWVTTVVDRNGTSDVEDLQELRVEVRDNSGARLYDEERTLVALGGL